MPTPAEILTDRYIEGFLDGQALSYCEMVNRGVRLAGFLDVHAKEIARLVGLIERDGCKGKVVDTGAQGRAGLWIYRDDRVVTLIDAFEAKGSHVPSDADTWMMGKLFGYGDTDVLEFMARRSTTGATVVRCLDCGLHYADFPLDMTLPDEQWLAIHPDDGGVLCAGCIVKRAEKLPGRIAVRARIEFGGNSAPTGRDRWTNEDLLAGREIGGTLADVWACGCRAHYLGGRAVVDEPCAFHRQEPLCPRCAADPPRMAGDGRYRLCVTCGYEEKNPNFVQSFVSEGK